MLSENTILKAIHNSTTLLSLWSITANAKWKYNFESNSQRTDLSELAQDTANAKWKYNFESNSQVSEMTAAKLMYCEC